MKQHKKTFQSKKIVVLLVGILGLLGLLTGVGTTLASFRSSEEEENDFRVGDLSGVITETFTPPTNTTVNDPVTKKLSVKNEGNNAIFVRVMVVPEISYTNSDGDVELLPATIGEEVLLLDGTGTEIADTSTWVIGEDGYYYYLKAIGAGESTTTALFEQVKLASTITAEAYEDASFKVEVKLESINTTKWSYREAWWNGDSTRWAVGMPLKTVDDALQNEVTS